MRVPEGLTDEGTPLLKGDEVGGEAIFGECETERESEDGAEAGGYEQAEDDGAECRDEDGGAEIDILTAEGAPEAADEKADHSGDEAPRVVDRAEAGSE